MIVAKDIEFDDDDDDEFFLGLTKFKKIGPYYQHYFTLYTSLYKQLLLLLSMVNHVLFQNRMYANLELIMLS